MSSEQEYAGLTRGERAHNLVTRMLQVIAVACVVGSFLVEYHSALQLVLMLGGLLCAFLSTCMGRWVVVDDE